MAVTNLFVVGAGQMGAGIGQLAAQAGIRTTLMDSSERLAQDGVKRIEQSLLKRIDKGKMDNEEKDAILSRIRVAKRIEEASSADFVIEAIVEDIEIKKKVFSDLDNFTNVNAILASNTTALSISEIASATKHHERVIGMHFFNPPVVMKLVEIIPGIGTKVGVVDSAREFALALGKDPVITKIETPGGIVSRVLSSLLNEAVLVYESGVASAEDVDKAMKMGTNMPMGPLALIDLIGLDVHMAKMETLYRELGGSRYRTPYLIRKMVKAGHLGVKTGKGFYDYD